MSGNTDLKLNETAAHAPDAVRKWAQRIIEKHDCPGTLSNEVNGYHLYIPCPACLPDHGRKELDDPKYSINLSMLAGIGQHADYSGEKSWMPGKVAANMDKEGRREYGSSICMRTRSSRNPHRFTIEELMQMGTVTERHPDILTKAAVHGGTGSAEREEMWEVDPISGKSAPPPAGKVIPLNELPPNHPAVAYLTSRGFNIDKLVSQFRCGFCEKEFDGEEKAIFYRRFPAGWKDTPQHRVIFHSLIDGVPLTWQARVIEKLSDDGLDRYMLHPYAGGFFPTTDLDKVVRLVRDQGFDGVIDTTVDKREGGEGIWAYVWSHTHTRSNSQSEWIPVPPFDEMRDGTLKFKPSKYRTAKYSSRQMMGWDAAAARAAADPDQVKWVVLCEGPLDAARVGPGGVALIGSSISQENASKVAGMFHIAFSAFDNDKPGREATEKITKTLLSASGRAPILQGVQQLPIPLGGDLGEMSDEEFDRIMKRAMKDLKRRF